MHRTTNLFRRTLGVAATLGLSALALTWAGGQPAAAQGLDGGSDVVCLYTSANFRGQSICVDSATKLARLRSNQNDRITSFRIADGWGLKVCENFNYGGWCRYFDNDIRRLRDSNDKISSFEVFELLEADVAPPPPPPPPAEGVVCLYPDAEFRGEPICAAGETRVSRLQSWQDDRITSFRIQDGWKLRACRDRNFGGWCREFTSSEARLRASNDAISSFEVTRLAPPPPPPPPPVAGVVCLYSEFNFQGSSSCFDEEVTVRRLRSWEDNRISSFRIAEGWTLRACRDANFGGWCREFTRDETQLRASNDSISSFEISRTAAPPPPPPPPVAGAVCLYRDFDFRGAAMCFDEEVAVQRLRGSQNDSTSSFRVAEGWRLRACQHRNFGGWCRDFTRDEARLRASNDAISSFEITRVPVAPPPARVACLFSEPNFGGLAVCSNQAERISDLGPRLNDRISSVRLADGWSMVICTDANMQGRCARLDDDAPGFGPRFDDRISSYEVFQTAVAPPQQQPDPGIISGGPDGPVINLPGIIGAIAGEVCFFEHSNFRGASVCHRAGAEERNLGANNDRISSIRVPSGLVTIVCEHVNFGGTCRQIDRDTPFVGDMNDRISSYRVTPNL